MPGSIDDLYRKSIAAKPYMRSDAVSELDKLGYMLVTDEFEYLLSQKAARLAEMPHNPEPTKLDRLAELWERVFPGNRVLREAGALMFATNSGDNTIGMAKLSQGEKSALYYAAAVLYAMPDAVIFVDSPSLFMHPAILNNLWNAIEQLRPDCTFVYDSVDDNFISSRTENVCVWIKSYEAAGNTWDYEILDGSDLTDDIFVDLIGSRKPVLFIEGDSKHSLDAKLYPLVFTDYTVRPLGSCNKVIETTRSFNDLKRMHHLDSHGIVDRDRRTEEEVAYLRRKNIFVPEVAEIENLFMLEEVIKTMAARRGRDPKKVFGKVRRNVMRMFASHSDEQALQHVRHKVKRDVECRIDARFTCITALEMHLRGLVDMLRPRACYNELRRTFRALLDNDDYAGVLKVFNHKPMLPDSNVAQLLGYRTKEDYVSSVLGVLKGRGKDGRRLRAAIKYSFGLTLDDAPASVPAQDTEPTAPRKGRKTIKNTR